MSNEPYQPEEFKGYGSGPGHTDDEVKHMAKVYASVGKALSLAMKEKGIEDPVEAMRVWAGQVQEKKDYKPVTGK